MNKMNWITILLDGTVPMDNIAQLIDESFALTESKKGMRKGRNNGPRDWLVPANPRLFDLIAAFESRDELYWTQSSQVRPGDLVYIYVGVPYSAVMYKCKALEVDIPAENGKHMMRIRLLAKYEPGVMPLPRMREEFGVYGVRGPRSIPHSMKMELQHHE